MIENAVSVSHSESRMICLLVDHGAGSESTATVESRQPEDTTAGENTTLIDRCALL